MSSLTSLPPLQPLAVDPASLSSASVAAAAASAASSTSRQLPLPLRPAPPNSSSSTTTATVPADGAPTSPTTGSRRPPQSGQKRRRTASTEPADAADSPTASTSASASKRDGKKKKASRACALCQKAHLTCDDSRPCQRCTKRGVADQCVEGHRKRAKYLLDEDELQTLKRKRSVEATQTSPTPQQQQQPQQPQQRQPPLQPPAQQPPAAQPNPVFTPPDPLFGAFTLDPGLFGSEAAGLEYSYMSQMLGKTSPDSAHDLTASPPSAPPSSSTAEFPSGWPADIFSAPPPGSSIGGVAGTGAGMGAGGTYEDFPGASFLASPVVQHPPSPAQPLHPLAPRFPAATSESTFVFGPAAYDREIGASALDGGYGGSGGGHEVYASVTRPYDYTEGYHFLMKILPHRFEKNDILRIVRALAIFRPSLIALQMPLSEEDEVFVEKSLQRSIIELNKLISYVGTPTVVWRRTGEICLVGPEFCMLTDWSKEELLVKRKYIWELFENQSVVEYWENFATHAFENTTQSVYSHCVLLKPDGSPVPATFCFHIRRDIFDLPSLVIGQWLPLL